MKYGIMIYRLKHKPTGLYYAKGTLSERGKVYTSHNNYCTYLRGGSDDLFIPRKSKLVEKYPILEQLDCTTAEEFERPWVPDIRIRVKAEDFEKEYWTGN